MLTDAKIKKLRPQDKRYRLHDADGLLLEVRPNGSKSWVLRYTEGGKRRDKALGRYPAMSLREARQAANDALLLIQRGENVFIVSASAVNYRHEQKNLPRRYQSRAICASPSPAGKSRKRTAPRQVDLYDVFCAILYLQRTGCSWRALPGDFPKWRTVHSYFQRWTGPRESGISILEEALKKSGSCGAPQAGAP